MTAVSKIPLSTTPIPVPTIPSHKTPVPVPTIPSHKTPVPVPTIPSHRHHNQRPATASPAPTNSLTPIPVPKPNPVSNPNSVPNSPTVIAHPGLAQEQATACFVCEYSHPETWECPEMRSEVALRLAMDRLKQRVGSGGVGRKTEAGEETEEVLARRKAFLWEKLRRVKVDG